MEKVDALIFWVEGERLGGVDLFFFWRSTSGRRQNFTSKNKKSHHEGNITVYIAVYVSGSAGVHERIYKLSRGYRLPESLGNPALEYRYG